MDNNHYPLISVVMATYNGVHFISAQLDSILQQTYPNVEVIIVDDQSTDGSIELLQNYVAKYPNVKLYLNEKNLGYVKNFEKGMLLATGDFIAPSDQDDIWLPEKLTILMRERGNHTIVFCNSELINDRGEKVGKKLSDIKRLVSYDDCLTYAIGNAAAGHAMLFPKILVERCVPLPTMIPHDYWLGFVATFDSPLKYIDTPLVLYRQHSGNVFGAAKIKAADGTVHKQKKKTKALENIEARERMKLLYEKCPASLTEQKEVYRLLNKSYQNFSLQHNFLRMILFFQYNKRIMAFKHRSMLRRWLFCLKMFVQIK